MANKDPRQEVIRTLSRFLTPAAKASSDRLADAGSAGDELATTIGGFRFLREKTMPTIPGRMLLAATNAARAHDELLISYLVLNTQGLWRYSGGASMSFSNKSRHTIVLGGGGWPAHFHAGGYVVDKQGQFERIRLITANGVSMEDTVQGGIVLFFTDQHITIPIQAEMYSQSGQLVGKQSVFGNQ